MSEACLPAFLISYSDSSFTNPHEAVRADEPPDCAGNFTHMGAKYWGFETSRHKATTLNPDQKSFSFDHEAHHWLKIGLESRSLVNRVTVSTRWFTGNQVPEVAIDLIDDGVATEVVARARLAPDQEHEFSIAPTLASECLIRCYHEGGIARINLFGDLMESAAETNLLDSAGVSHVSNEHYGRPDDAVAGDRNVDYMFGWESARTGYGESALFTLNKPSRVNSIVVDTYLHRLNPPLSCHVYALMQPDESKLAQDMALRPEWLIEFNNGHTVQPSNLQQYMQDQQYLSEPDNNNGRFDVRLENQHTQTWLPLVSFGVLRPDTWHRFDNIEFDGPVTHILYMHFPNGGIHGLKVFGTEQP